jgi:hypothetical protein
MCSLLAVTGLFLPVLALAPPADSYFEIHIVDDATGRGVPLVEVETVNRVRFVSDSAGRVALAEPGLMGRDTFFKLRTHGYAVPKDGFGFPGVRLTPKPGEKAVIRLKRTNVAERLYRLTGEGIYRDSVLLGHKVPLAEPVHNGGVMGQDSTQAVVYRGKIYWFWGDTSFTRHALGNFRTSGATSELPVKGGLDPAVGVNLRYFTDAKGFARPMCPLGKEPGVVWIDGVAVVADDKGQERMIAHYARLKSLGEMLEHGIALWNDDKEIFEPATPLDLKEKWRFPRGQALRDRDGEVDYLYFAAPFATVRVRAELKAVLDPAAYEALSSAAGSDAKPSRAPDGELRFLWRKGQPPHSAAIEERWLKQGDIKPEEAMLLPVDVDGGKRVRLHGGSIRFNAHRKRWVLIAVEQGGTSFLGEVWYAEAEIPTGPWLKAKKIVTHEKYSFYNPVQHAFFDQGGGRTIYFEGTYTHTFSGSADATPRYDYNQIMYRLDVEDERLKGVR